LGWHTKYEGMTRKGNRGRDKNVNVAGEGIQKERKIKGNQQLSDRKRKESRYQLKNGPKERH